MRNMGAADAVLRRVEDGLKDLSRISAEASAAMGQIRIAASQAVETNTTLSTMRRSVSDVTDAAMRAANQLERVKMEPGQAAGTVAELGVERSAVESLTDALHEATRAWVEMGVARRVSAGGGGARGGGGFLAGILPGGQRAGVGAIGLGIGLGVATAPALAPAALGIGAALPAAMEALVGTFAVTKLAFADLTAKAFTSQKAFDALTPVQQQFVQTLRSLDAGLKKNLEHIAQGIVIPGLTAAIHQAVTPASVNMLTQATTEFSTSVSNAAQAWGKLLGSTGFAQSFGMVLRADARYAQDFFVGLSHMFDALVHLQQAAIPFTNWLDSGALKFTEWVDRSVQAAQSSGQLAHYFNEAKTSLQALGGLVSSMAGAIHSLVNVFGGFTTAISVIHTLGHAFDVIGSLLNAIRPVMTDLAHGLLWGINLMLGGIQSLMPQIRNLSKAFDGVLKAFKPFAPIVGGIFRTVLHVLGDFIRESTAIFKLFGDLLTLRWSKLWDDLKNVVAGWVRILKDQISGLFGWIKSAFSDLWNFISGSGGGGGAQGVPGLQGPTGTPGVGRPGLQGPTKAPRPSADIASALGQMRGLSVQQQAIAAANAFGVDPNLFLALINQESGFNQGAVSPAGAIGLTQLMPGTAAGLGVDPRNASQNLIGGAKYLSQQLQTFGNIAEALAAYNAGPGAVSKALARGGPDNFLKFLPAETQNYVKTILSRSGQAGYLPGQNPYGTPAPFTQDTGGGKPSLLSQILPPGRQNLLADAQARVSEARARLAEATTYQQKIAATRAIIRSEHELLARIGTDEAYITREIAKQHLNSKQLIEAHRELKILAGQEAASEAEIARALKQQHQALQAIRDAQFNARIARLLGIGPEVAPSAQRLRFRERQILTQEARRDHLDTTRFQHETLQQIIRDMQRQGFQFPASTLESLRKINQALLAAEVGHHKLNSANLQNIRDRLTQINETLRTGQKQAFASNYVPIGDITGGIGLTPAQREAIRQRQAESQAHAGKRPGGYAVAGVPLTATGTPVGYPGHANVRTVLLTQYVHIVIEDKSGDRAALARALREELARHARRGSVQLRGGLSGASIGLG